MKIQTAVKNSITRREFDETCAKSIRYVPNDLFMESQKDPNIHKTIMEDMPDKQRYDDHKKSIKPTGGGDYFFSAYHETPLLSKEQEQHLFRKMNYLKFMAENTRQQIQATEESKRTMASLNHMRSLLRQATEIQNHIISANMRLVISIVKRQKRHEESFEELVSDGNLSLMRAVSLFDYQRGYKFSTYAVLAIIKNFSQKPPISKKRAFEKNVTIEEIADNIHDYRTDEREAITTAEEASYQVRCLISMLEPIEQQIIASRHGIDCIPFFRCRTDEHTIPTTMKQIGMTLGLTKEAIRIACRRIQDKMQYIAHNFTNIATEE